MAAELVSVAWDDPRAAQLRDAMDAEIGPRYADRFAEVDPAELEVRARTFAVHPEDIVATFLVLEDGEPASHAALRKLGEQWELKRVITLPRFRGRGHSTTIIRAIEDEVRRRGGTRLILQTGDRQPEAVRLYEHLGYTRIPIFEPYTTMPTSLCFGKDLV